jgi:hypothetical protein
VELREAWTFSDTAGKESRNDMFVSKEVGSNYCIWSLCVSIATCSGCDGCGQRRVGVKVYVLKQCCVC